MENTTLYNRFSKDIDWSVRFLSIYNINVNTASEIVHDIIDDLSAVSWSHKTEPIRQKLFMERLREKVRFLKESSTVAA